MYEDPQITLEWLISEGACYYAEDGTPKCELGEWLKPKLPITATQLARMRKIPVEDKLWALHRLMSDEQARLAARLSALSVIDSWDAPQVVVDWLKTGDESLKSAAWSAADSAAWAAARYAAWSAEGSSARYAADSAALSATAAARSAAESASWSAARSAAWSAEGSSARSAAESAALKRAIQILTGEHPS